MSDACEHLGAIEEVRGPRERVCDECTKIGGRWVHLRTCQTCGATHCCDSSPNKHATAHFRATQHPIVASAEPGEHWLWCYVDEEMIEYEPRISPV